MNSERRKHIHTACHSQLVTNCNYSVICIVTVASKASTSAYFFLSGIFRIASNTRDFPDNIRVKRPKDSNQFSILMS